MNDGLKADTLIHLLSNRKLLCPLPLSVNSLPFSVNSLPITWSALSTADRSPELQKSTISIPQHITTEFL